MTKETQRIIVASILITLVAYFYPNFINMNNKTIPEEVIVKKNTTKEEVPVERTIINTKKTLADKNYQQQTIVVSNKLYSATISNHSGGSFLQSKMIEKKNDDYKYLQKKIQTTDEKLIYLGDAEDPVVLKGGTCNPCLGYYDDDLKQYHYINVPFEILTPNIKSNYSLDEGDTLILDFQYAWDGMLINKSVVFYGSSYETVHNYYFENPVNNRFEIIWDGGLNAIDQEDFNWDSWGAGNAMIGQDGETESIVITNGERTIEREEYTGVSDWVSVRTKYFIAAILSNKSADYATMAGYVDDQLDGGRSYTVGLGYYNDQTINSSVYLGPLDIDHIVLLNNSLDDTINFGFKIVRPIGKFVLWFLKLIHNTFNLNYGICLIIFAAIIQVITSPLTKKTYESSRKMQEIQPLVKKIQEKYKDDAQKMNQEVMKIYREKGVNPLGGCLPLLLQMPLLMAIFSVFRDTIEFRGASFFLWINDLSQPDILFHLPFNIPLYGDHVAFLPILMGISIFLTQKLSMATADPSQKPIMYIMNGVFVLIFNGFPSGLNLYYTVYNLLNYYQQKIIRSKNS